MFKVLSDLKYNDPSLHFDKTYYLISLALSALRGFQLTPIMRLTETVLETYTYGVKGGS